MLKSSMKMKAASIGIAIALTSARDLGAAHDSLNLSTGYEEGSGGTTADGLPDQDYTIQLPGGTSVAATVLPSDQWPISPAGPWYENSSGSKWIGLAAGASTGPPGDYYFVRTVEVPPDVPAQELEIVGWWTSDNAALDIEINGASTGITSSGDFSNLQRFPGGTGQGRFHSGTNQIRFRVNNAPGTPPNPDNPVGLRVEASLVLSWVFGRNCWDDLPLDTSFGVGATFAADGASYAVHPFTLADGTLYTFGSARIVEGAAACQSGHELQVSNVNLDIDFGIPLSVLDIHFGEYGGNINLTINGDFFNGFDFRDAPSGLGGVAVSTLEFGSPGQSCGVLRLRGYIGALRIGGMELTIDCLDATRVPQFKRGDTNGDGEVDIADVAHVAESLFVGTPALDCRQTADVNGDGLIDLTDEVVINNFLFLSSNPLRAPGAFVCGPDPDPSWAVQPCTYNHCAFRPDFTLPAIELNLNAPPTLSGPPGTKIAFEVAVDLCWQSQSGTQLVIDAIRGWGFGVSRVGRQPVTIQSATVAGTDAERAFGASFHRSDVVAAGSSLASSVLLDFTPGVRPIVAPLLPTGTGASCQAPERLLRIALVAEIPSTPGTCYEESFRFAEGLQGSGQPVPIRVAYTGRLNGVPTGGVSVRPAIGPSVAVRVCADNTAPGSRVTVDAGSGVTVTFPLVGKAGYTSATPTGSGQPPPGGFQVLDTAGGSTAYFSVSTTATYEGLVEICFPYTPPPGLTPAQEEQAIRLMVYEPAQRAWSDVTTRVDTTTRTVCGTSHLSDFGLFVSQDLSPVKDRFRRGDSNTDSAVDISDAVSILNFLFAGLVSPRCLDAADANDDGDVDISDAVRVLNFLFAGGDNGIPAPGPSACGSDPTNDLLESCDYSATLCGE